MYDECFTRKAGVTACAEGIKKEPAQSSQRSGGKSGTRGKKNQKSRDRSKAPSKRTVLSPMREKAISKNHIHRRTTG